MGLSFKHFPTAVSYKNFNEKAHFFKIAFYAEIHGSSLSTVLAVVKPTITSFRAAIQR